MNIAVVGTGYVGLVGGTCFAETGNNVVCVDIDEDKINKMRQGIVPIYEPGLETIFHRNIEQGRLKFTTSLEEGIKDAEIIFLALPTPPGADGSADLRFVLKVADDLGDLITDYKVIVDKSTVPVGTAEKVHNKLAEKLDESLFDVVSNPEFLREGAAVGDFLKPDRVVIGTSSDKAKATMGRLYEPFVRQGNPVVYMDERSAEMTKYAANSFLATKITFMNEVANLCELTGANVDMVRLGIGSDTRIGNRFLFAGIGYGGSCFPKDVQALAKTSTENNYDFKLLNAVMDVNTKQKLVLAEKVLNYFGGNIKGKTFAIWGLAFKPNTDDVREAPALYIIDKLLAEGANVQAFDPEAMETFPLAFNKEIKYCNNQYEALDNADALLILTEWNVFRTPDLQKVKAGLNEPLIFDGRNVFDVKEMQKNSFKYISIGRPTVNV